jgi:hypothetical protein
MDAVRLKKLIANSIKKADSSYFFEDYGKQADAVMKMLQSKGFTVVPKEASEEMCKFAADNMATGRMKPEAHVGHVYKTMVEFAARKK